VRRAAPGLALTGFDRYAVASYGFGMSVRPWVYALPAVLGIGAAGWLFRENRSLEKELAEARRALAPAEASAGGAAEPSAEPARPRRGAPGGGVGGFLRGLGRASSPDPPSIDPPERESRADRRRRRMDELRAMFGRDPGESAEDYKARVLPMVTGALIVPRARMEEARRAAEQAADVTDKQRVQLDALFEDVTRETLALTNQAIASGDLTPYERNISGMLSWGGGLGAILDSTNTRIAGILSPEQRDVLVDQGFEWGEYLGARMPWETLEPPPPPAGEATGDRRGGI
jgi:hypothetical protein